MEKIDGRRIREYIASSKAEELSEEVRNTIMQYANSAESWRQLAKQNREDIEHEIINEHDKENAALKERLRFCVVELHSEKELEAYKAFCKKHEACRIDTKFNGGKMPYVMQFGSGIGICTKVVCQVCGEKQDITDSTVW